MTIEHKKGDHLERVFGSRRFARRTRNPALPSPERFEPTVKRPEDVVI